MASFHYRIDLQYFGKNYSGWQSQPDGSAVQDHLEKALKIFLGEPCRVIGASRTDSGVNAKQQVALIKRSQELTLERFVPGINALLPKDIGIMSCVPCSPDFHPIACATAKIYCYRFWCGRSRQPFVEPFVCSAPPKVDIAAMKEAIAGLVGEFDFSAFCAVDSSAKTKQRTILAAELRERGNLIELWFMGTGFLKQMIRIMAGTILEVGQGKRSSAEISELLANGDRTKAGKTAQGQGLTLEKLFFDDFDSGRLKEEFGIYLDENPPIGL